MVRMLAAVFLLAALAPAAHAFMIVPAEDAPGGYVIGVEGDLGDRIAISALPQMFQNPADPVWRDGLSFRWRYFRSSEKGEAVLALNGAGRPVLAVELFGDELADGDTLAVALGLTDRGGAVMHMVYVAAAVTGEAFANGTNRHRALIELDFEQSHWGQVGGFVVFTMKYYAIQKLDADGVADAMRRAVEREAGGGSEQWATGGA